MSSEDGVAETLRPWTRSHARAIRPSAERASPGKNATPVRAARLRAPSDETMRAAEISHPLGVVLEQDHLVLVGAVRREHVARPHLRRHDLAHRLRRRPGRDVQPQHREHAPGRRRLVALLLQAALEIGVRRDPAHAHRGPAPLDHQRRPSDRDRLAGEHRRALPGRAAGCRAGASRWCCRGPRSAAPTRRAAARGGARRSRRRCARRRRRRARSSPSPPRAGGASRRCSPPSRSGGERRPRRGARPPRAPWMRRKRSRRR